MQKKIISGKEEYSKLLENDQYKAYLFTKKDSLKRTRNNEDSIGFIENFNDSEEHFFAVSDGMGGLNDADKASSLAIKTCFQGLEKEQNTTYSIKKASEKVIKNADGGGATLILCRWTKNFLDFYSVGDSVAAIFNENGDLMGKTLAQNPYFFSKEAGVLDHIKNGETPPANVLLNFIGKPQLFVMSYPQIENPKGSFLFLGSDGFWENIEDEYLSFICREKNDFEEKTLKIVTYFQEIEKLAEFKADDLSFIMLQKL